MIQAPNQYPQVKAPRMAANAPAPQAQAPATPMSYYNQQNQGVYQYPQAQPSQANAVNIQIYNPQAYAGGAAPQVQAPVQPPVMPAQYVQVPPVQQPVPQPTPVAQPTPVVVEEAAPQPTPPAPVIKEAPKAETTPAAEAPKTVETPKAEAPTVEAPEAQAVTVDLGAYVTKLGSANLEEQGKVIEEIAEMTQNEPAKATQLLDTRVVDGLLAVIAKDTTELQGPTPNQLELRQKLLSGKELTPEEKAEAETITPMEAAERNKQYALYTIAFLQNLLHSEVEQRSGMKLDIKDLPAMEQVVQTAKSDPNPLIRVSAIAALAHIAKPEYKEVLSEVFELAKADADPNVQKAATKAQEQLTTMGEAAAAPVKEEAPKAEEKKA